MLAVVSSRSSIGSIVRRFGDSRKLYVEPFLRDAKCLLQQAMDRQPHEVRGSFSRVRQLLMPQLRVFDSILTLDAVSQFRANLRRDSTDAILSGV